MKKKQAWILVCVLVLLAVLATGCGGSSAGGNYAKTEAYPQTAPAEAYYSYDEAESVGVNYDADLSSGGADLSTEPGAADPSAKLIYTVDLSVETLDYEKSIQTVDNLVAQYGGACFPAHIDRHSYSILSALGDFSEDLQVAAFELTMQADEAHYRDTYPALKNKLLLRDSDAHYLENILLPSQTIDLAENTPQALIDRLRQGI